jgi:acetyl esterase
VLPGVATFLAKASEEPLPSPDLTVPELRTFCNDGYVARTAGLFREVELREVRELTSPGGVPCRLYLPSDATDLPLHVHLHGGGWWMGSLDTADPIARELAASGLAVLSVGYRLAPEHPWPAGLEDVYEVLTWIAGDYPSVSIGGESAGANLAAVVALMARDRGGPRLVAQWLDIPPVDLRIPEDESVRLYGTGYGLEIAQMAMLLAWYGADPDLPYVSPARADLTGLPPAIITTAECDPVRDQGEAYAAALAAAGVPVELRRARGHIHASSWLTGLDEGTAAWHDEVVSLLHRQHRALEASA